MMNKQVLRILLFYSSVWKKPTEVEEEFEGKGYGDFKNSGRNSSRCKTT